MILALVSPSPDLLEKAVDVLMASRSKVQRFSVAHRPLQSRPFALRAALERDRFNADWLTVVPVDAEIEVDTVRRLGGVVGHLRGLVAHPSIRIERHDLIITLDSRTADHVIAADDAYSIIRCRYLAARG